jgi:predicted Zn-ribbon and HTH transcriptional regulator
MSYIWERETITVSEITAILMDQYNNNSDVVVMINEDGKRFDYKRELVPVLCNRCGNEYQTTPQILLSMKDDCGYACSKCGNLSMEQLQKKLARDRLIAGTKLADELGIDRSKDDEESEEEKEKKLQEDYEKELARLMYTTEDINEKIDILKIEENVSPVPISAKEELNTLNKENVIEIGDIPVFSQEELNALNKENAVEIEGDGVSVFTQEEYDEFIENNPESTESDEPFKSSDTPWPHIYFNDDEEKGEMPLDDNDGENEENDDEDIDFNNILPEIKPENSKIIEELEKKEEPPPEEKIILNGKEYSKERINSRFNEINSILYEELGYAPYECLSYNPDEPGSLTIKCNVCKKEFKILSTEQLLNDGLHIDKAFCIAHGLTYKGTINISACPNCKISIATKGYNEFLRKAVETLFTAAHVIIINPESYWYASPLASYKVEANGVQREIKYASLFNEYRNVDLSKHPNFIPEVMFTEVNSEEKTSKDTSFKIPKQEKNDRIYVNSDINAGEYEADQHEKAKQASMFFKSAEILRKSRESVAVLDAENPFLKQQKLENLFKKSIFYEFVNELAKECQVEFRVKINQKTFEIPIVDFEPYGEGKPGYRFVCIDYKERSMVNVPIAQIAHSVPFSFRSSYKGEDDRNYKFTALYSDSLLHREKAIFNALLKYINPKKLAYGGRRIEISKNLQIQYTNYDGYLREFAENCSPYPDGKPHNGELGIIVTWFNQKKTSPRDMLDAITSYENRNNNKANLSTLENDYSQYVVCSIRYIEQPCREVNNGPITHVIYTITEYIEIGGTLIADGLYCCIQALLKDYYMNYPSLRDKTPYIVVEIDFNNYPSPTLKHYIERNVLVPVDNIFKAQIKSKTNYSDTSDNLFFTTNFQVPQYLRYSYIRKPEFRKIKNDYMRRDMRKFNANSLIKLMPEEIKAAGLQLGIYDDIQRKVFITNMGFVRATQLEVLTYFVSQGILRQIMLDGETIMLPMAVSPESAFNSGGIVDSSSDSVNTIHAINPLFNMKMGRIFNDPNISPEARDFYNNYMIMQRQNEMMKQQQGNIWNWQNPSYNMTPGAYYMPNMPGME